MKILYHHRTLGDGAEGIHVAEMVKAFRAQGHEVKVVSLIGEATNSATKGHRRWSKVARFLPGFLYEMAEMGYNLKGYSTLAKAAREFRPDFIYDRYVSFNYSAVAVGRRLKIPVILEVNSPYAYQRTTFDEKVYFKRIIRAFERKICTDSSRVIVVSTTLKKILAGIGVPAERIVVMPNGVDPEAFHPRIDGAAVRQKLSLGDKTVVGFTGILRPWHGLDLLVEAFARLSKTRPKLHLVLIGDGPSRAEVEALAARLGMSDKLTVTGRLPHGEVKNYVAALDIAVSPRATPYSSPMKILEYMGLAKAIVAPDMENIRDIIVPGKNGVLFETESVESLAEQIRTLCEDPELRERLGKEARRTIDEGRTWAHNARDVVSIVESLKTEAVPQA